MGLGECTELTPENRHPHRRQLIYIGSEIDDHAAYDGYCKLLRIL